MKKNISSWIFFLLISFLFTGTGNNYAGTCTLKYVIHSFVKIETFEGKIIYIDPYSLNELDPADVILITHEDSDHNQLSRVIQKSNCQVIRSANAIQNGIYQSFTIGNIKITAVPAYDQWHPKSKCVGYIVEVDGIKLYHAGDTGRIPEMADLASQKINYALLPMYIGGEEMNLAADMIQAEHVIPIHTNWPNLTYNTDLVAQFTSPKKLVVLPGEMIEIANGNSSSTTSVLRVPQDYPSIQAAINAAEKGDTVLVAEGTYYENINYKGKGIVVASRYIQTKDWQTVFNTIIDGSKCVNKDTASTVQFLNKEDSTAVLEGFTITGGTGTKYRFPYGTGSSIYQEGAGVIMHYSSSVIRNNYIVNNIMKPNAGIQNGGGGGIASMYGNPNIYNNVIISNSAGYAAGIVLNWSGGKIKNNIVYHNKGGASYGTGGVMLWQTPANSAFLENNTIVGNISLTDAGGVNIKLSGNAIPVVKNNIIWGNRQVSGKQVLNPQYAKYNNIEDYTDANNISSNPDLNENTFLLTDGSFCIDAGDPDLIYNDIENPNIFGKALLPSKGNLRNDIGAFGGAFSKLLAQLDVDDIYTPNKIHQMIGQTEKDGLYKIELLNLSSHSIRIDSISVKNKNIFRVSSKLDIYSDKGKRILGLLENDTIRVNYKPVAAGTVNDTIYVYHNASGISNPLKIPIKLTATAVGVNEENSLPNDFKLFQNEPNPFNPSTRIRFNVAYRSNVALKIYDILGREVDKLINEEMEAGQHSVVWNPKHGISSGVYLVNLVADNFQDTKKMIYQK